MPVNLVSKERIHLKSLGKGFVVIKPIPVTIEQRYVRHEHKTWRTAGDYFVATCRGGVRGEGRTKRKAIADIKHKIESRCYRIHLESLNGNTLSASDEATRIYKALLHHVAVSLWWRPE